MHREHAEVLVVGAGPAGLCAARAAAEHSVRVVLLDDNPRPGGQIWRGDHRERDRLIDALAHRRVTTWSNCRVVALLDARTLLVERSGSPAAIAYDRLILATGARERFVPFPGWHTPNVVGLGGLQALIKSGLTLRGQSVVLAGTGPLLLAVAATAKRAGARIECVAEQASLSAAARFSTELLRHPSKIGQAVGMLASGLAPRLRFGTWPTRVHGKRSVERVDLVDDRGRTQSLTCNWLACAYGLVPNLELARLLGCEIEDEAIAVDEHLATSVEHVFACGEATGIAGVDAARLEGTLAGHAAAGHNQQADSLVAARRRHVSFGRAIDRAFALDPRLRELADDDTLLCRCEDVRVGDVRSRTHASWRGAKLHTRCGMGPCQGRVCGPAAAFLFDTPPSGVRPPVFPTSVAVLASVTTSAIADPSSRAATMPASVTADAT